MIRLRELDEMEFKHRIIPDPGICGGDAVVAGTCVTIRTILVSPAEWDIIADILADFPSLSEEHV